MSVRVLAVAAGLVIGAMLAVIVWQARAMAPPRCVHAPGPVVAVGPRWVPEVEPRPAPSPMATGVEGVLRDAAGGVLAGVTITVLPIAPTAPTVGTTTMTDRDGRFLLTLPTGRYEIVSTSGALRHPIYIAQRGYLWVELAAADRSPIEIRAVGAASPLAPAPAPMPQPAP